MIIKLFGVFAIFYFGFLFVRLLENEMSFLEKWLLGFPIGIGLFTFFLFLLNLVGVPFGLKNSFLLLYLLIICLAIINHLFKPFRIASLVRVSPMKKLKELIKSRQVFVIIFAVLIAYILLSVFLYDFYWPVRDWDALVLYDFRAKSFLATGWMTDAISRGYFFGYPLLTSLAHLWVYQLGMTNPMFLYALFYLSFVFSFYFILRRFNSTPMALFLTLIAISYGGIFSQAQIAYTNLPYLVYLILSYGYLFAGLKNRKVGYLLISAVLLGLSTWTRSTEPFWLISLAVAIMGTILVKKYLGAFYYLTITILIRYPWIGFVNANYKNIDVLKYAPQTIGLFFSNISISRINQVTVYVWRNVYSQHYISIAAVFLLAVFLIVHKKFKGNSALLLFSLLGNLIFIWIGTYLLSITKQNWKAIGESAQRMSIFLTPLCLLIISYFINLAEGKGFVHNLIRKEK